MFVFPLISGSCKMAAFVYTVTMANSIINQEKAAQESSGSGAEREVRRA